MINADDQLAERLGGYVIGTLDQAASRGHLSEAAVKTMVNRVLGWYTRSTGNNIEIGAAPPPPADRTSGLPNVPEERTQSPGIG